MIVPIGWTTEIFNSPEFIKIEFTPEDVEKIKKIMTVVKENGLEHATLNFEAEYFNDKECTEECSDFRSDVHQLRIFHDGVYFYAQHKHDSATQIESQEITLEELESGIFDPSKYED